MTRLTGGPGTNSPGQFIGANVTLRMLLDRAYHLMPWQLAGAPLSGDRFDIAAKIPASATAEQVNLMLQNLLAERFGLVAHRETRDLPIYEAVVAKGGPKLKTAEKAPPGAPPPPNGRLPRDKDGFLAPPPGVPGMLPSRVNGNDRIAARMEPLGVLWEYLQRSVLRPIIDKTGLTGVYDFNLTYLPDATIQSSPLNIPALPAGQAAALEAVRDPAPSLFDALDRQLGLKLEDKRGPVEVLVVDRVNKAPTED